MVAGDESGRWNEWYAEAIPALGGELQQAIVFDNGEIADIA